MLNWNTVSWPTKFPFYVYPFLTVRHAVRSKAFLFAIFRCASKGVPVHQNHDIPFKVVQVVSRMDGRLEPPVALEELLKATDLKKNIVQLVSSDPAIVRIFSHHEITQARKAAKIKRKAHKVEHKEVQLTWGISDRDLEHKLKKAKEELLKGNRVDVAFSPKSAKSVVPMDTMQRVLQNVSAILNEVGKEYKPAQSQGKDAVLSFEGRKPINSTAQN